MTRRALVVLVAAALVAGLSSGSALANHKPQHGKLTTIVSGLVFPTGMTAGRDGALYVSEQGFGFPAG